MHGTHSLCNDGSKAAWDDPDVALEKGFGNLHSFFIPKPTPAQPGRPAKSAETRGRPAGCKSAETPPAPMAATPVDTAAQAALPSSTTNAIMVPRTNWAEGEGLEVLSAAVDNWLGKKGAIIQHDCNISLKHYAARVEVP